MQDNKNRVLTAKDLSLEMGKAIKFVAEIESGKKKITCEAIKNFKKICETLLFYKKTTPDEFFAKNIEKYEEHKMLLDLYDKLSDESKTTIINLMNNLK